MNWKTKKIVIWTCYAVASAITLTGLVIHPAMFWAGMIALIAIMIFCFLDSRNKIK
jgi:hypothetical protein